VFTILGNVRHPLTVELLTSKPPTDFALEATKFQEQHPGTHIEIRKSLDFHDRFIISDDTTCWHVGCSIKDAGNRAFMLSRIEDSDNAETLIATLNATWEAAESLA
jgi:hypothetical protein